MAKTPEPRARLTLADIEKINTLLAERATLQGFDAERTVRVLVGVAAPERIAEAFRDGAFGAAVVKATREALATIERELLAFGVEVTP